MFGLWAKNAGIADKREEPALTVLVRIGIKGG